MFGTIPQSKVVGPMKSFKPKTLGSGHHIAPAVVKIWQTYSFCIFDRLNCMKMLIVPQKSFLGEHLDHLAQKSPIISIVLFMGGCFHSHPPILSRSKRTSAR